MKERSKDVEADGGHDKQRRSDQRGLDPSAWQRSSADFAFGARHSGGPSDKPRADAETGQRCCDEDRLIGRKPCEVAYPGPADARAEENERKDAARGSGQGAEQPACRQERQAASELVAVVFVLDRHESRMHPVVTTGSREIGWLQSQLRERMK